MGVQVPPFWHGSSTQAVCIKIRFKLAEKILPMMGILQLRKVLSFKKKRQIIATMIVINCSLRAQIFSQLKGKYEYRSIVPE